MTKEFNIKEFIDKVEDIIKDLKENEELQEKFEHEPVKTIEELTGLNLPDEKVEKAIEFVKAKIDDTDIEAKMAALEDKLEAFGEKLEGKLDGILDKLDK